MPKSSEKSYVWNFFTKKSSNICKCNICGKDFKTGGGTTNLKNHLLHKHSTIVNPCKKQKTTASESDRPTRSTPETSTVSTPAEDDEALEVIDSEEMTNSGTLGEQEQLSNLPSTSQATILSSSSKNVSDVSPILFRTGSSSSNQPVISSIFKNQRSYESGGTKESRITQSLLYMICKDNYPLSCTEKDGMKNFLKTTVPLYSAPSRRTITNLVEKKYSSMQQIVTSKLNTVRRMAITTDIATVMNATRSFIVLTLHYIDEEKSVMMSMCLGVKNLTPHHTGDNICEDLSEMFKEWSIKKENVVSATTDNGANIVAGVKKLLTDEKRSNVHVPCFAHTINLAVTKGLGPMKTLIEIIEKVKRIVSFFKHSNVAMDNLREEQKREGKTDGTFLYLIQEVPTRWNSTFYCLERFVLLSGHVGKILLSSNYRDAPGMLTSNELSVIKECIDLLRPFEDASKDISGENYVSGSCVIPLVNCIKTSLARINVSCPLVQELKDNLISQIKKRFDPLEKNILLSVSTLLDPRFKKIHFTSHENLGKTINILKEEVKLELKRQGSASPPQPLYSIDSSSSKQEQHSIWKVHEEVAAHHLPDQRDQLEGLPTELKLYLNQPIQSRKRDPIQFWADSKNAFPATYEVAIKYLTVVGSSVASERVVSSLNNVCNDHRSRLTPAHTNQLIFLGSLNNLFWEL